MTADELRRRKVGDVVTYVVNRNINFTNVCVKRCGFCAFSRGQREEEGYWLPLDEVVRRAKEAHDWGATEVCIQAGLPPRMQGDLYIKICEAIKNEAPSLHIHGFSPEEVLYGAKRSRWSIKEYLSALKQAGVGSLPGTSAEILDDDLRKQISPGRISVKQWREVITTAHELGIPTTSTIMYGHMETPQHIVSHMSLLKDIQHMTGGFTEFVPLSYVHTHAPMSKNLDNQHVIRKGPTGLEVMKMHSIARLFFNKSIPNLQVSWVKEGLRMAQVLLAGGVNDLGGCLINESISTSAGAAHGQMVTPADLIRTIHGLEGRVAGERNTLYSLRQLYPQQASEDGAVTGHRIDTLTPEEAERVFGSYRQLTQSDRYKYKAKQQTASS
mmetsp:Transcript_38163/g.61787  ORF Transcript_38163/g.61787 Transcript_38163/m.61787 type:complete len:384 (-) Transcript_38163:406-1557(-)